MLVRPMIGEWEVPRIEGIGTHESRRLAAFPVPGLAGELSQDLGRNSLRVRITGSLYGDEVRDEFLVDLREKFREAEPVDFIADIVNESDLEQVLIESFQLHEQAGDPDGFRYDIVLREYVEPPEPPGIGADFGAELGADLDFDADLGLDLLDLPGLLVDVPDLGDMLRPVKSGADELKEALQGAGDLLKPLDDALG